MTYCIAWKTDNDVFMIGDSAITYEGGYQSEISHTSFGEINIVSSDMSISESIIKINSISDKVIICYSGDADIARKYIDFIKCYIDNHSLTVLNVIELLANSFNSNNDVSLLIGFIEKGNSKLVHYTNGEIQNIEHFKEIGSIPAEHKFSKKIRWMLEYGINKFSHNGEDPFSSREILTAMVVTAQSYSVKYRLLNDGVGGAFFGVAINSDGIRWNEDISYLISNKGPDYVKGILAGIDYSEFITLRKINDVFIASSTNLKSPLALFQDFNYKTNKEKLNFIESDIGIDILSIKTEYFVMFNLFTEMITLIDIKQHIMNNFFRIWQRKRETNVDYFFACDARLIQIINFAQFEYEDEVCFNWILSEPREYMSRKEFLVRNSEYDKIKDWDDPNYI